jgi:hypothetical protein
MALGARTEEHDAGPTWLRRSSGELSGARPIM